ncbi:hypothetical protein MLD38_008236 [Melastoma candidum]|uniref:Uncharacterized protein n=1 Tax=Melastoma candidum TaxID=119954 RepID=A0ACB9RXZ4_9MYRT|nr:hypothetical protein MLD38_008236 [Melastoma candidum]
MARPSAVCLVLLALLAVGEAAGWGHEYAYCKNEHCRIVKKDCPHTCRHSCKVDCETCKSVCHCDKPGGVCQDPRFVGGDGVTFYFHGRQNRDFCLVTDPNLHINGHFIGKRGDNMTRDFTWVQSIGVLFDDRQLYVGAMKTGVWEDANDRVSLAVDGEPIYLPQFAGATWRSDSSPQITITRTRDTNAVDVEVEGRLKITAVVVPITQRESMIHNYEITEEDCFAHLDMGFKFYSLTDSVSGVLGQTYARNYMSRAKIGARMPVLGGEREFAASGLFATDCVASRFVGRMGREGEESKSSGMEYANMECASGGVDGTGVVCKR